MLNRNSFIKNSLIGLAALIVAPVKLLSLVKPLDMEKTDREKLATMPIFFSSEFITWEDIYEGSYGPEHITVLPQRMREQYRKNEMFTRLVDNVKMK